MTNGVLTSAVGFLSLLDRHHRYKGLEVLLRAVAAGRVPEVR